MTAVLQLQRFATRRDHQAQRARSSRRTERILRTPQSLPLTLSYSSALSSQENVVILAVQVREAVLAPRFSNQKVKVRVKYGDPRASVMCDTRFKLVEVEKPVARQFVARFDDPGLQEAVVDFGSVFLFQAVRFRETPIRVRLYGAPFGLTTIAKSQFTVPMPRKFDPESAERVIYLKDAHAEDVGTLALRVDMYSVTKEDLRKRLFDLSAPRGIDAFVLEPTSIVQGIVEEESLSKHGMEVVKGRPVVL